jgi:hypothetical protein
VLLSVLSEEGALYAGGVISELVPSCCADGDTGVIAGEVEALFCLRFSS